LSSPPIRIAQATENDLAEFATWRDEPPYDFYDGDAEPVKNPERFFAARHDESELVGFNYFEEKGDVREYELGLCPELTGKGQGRKFVRAGLAFGRGRFAPRQIVLNVAASNERAIRVYERVGFRETGRHIRRSERFGGVEFVEMEEQR